MGKDTILTPVQRRFLDIILKEPYLLRKYYWTGGTALSEIYLKHRDSQDIDLFTEKDEIHLPSIKKFVGIASTLLKSKSILHKKFFGLHTFVFKFPNDELKVDFNYYPFLRINKGGKWKGLEIDSLEDIAANKIHTISVNPRGRDYIDIFYILKKGKYSLDWLVKLAKAKFDWDIDPIQLGINFIRVVEFKDYPKMFVPFNPREMEKFFLDLAKSLEKDIFK